jgi:hypothetical protein
MGKDGGARRTKGEKQEVSMEVTGELPARSLWLNIPDVRLPPTPAKQATPVAAYPLRTRLG